MAIPVDPALKGHPAKTELLVTPEKKVRQVIMELQALLASRVTTAKKVLPDYREKMDIPASKVRPVRTDILEDLDLKDPKVIFPLEFFNNFFK